MKYFLKKYRNGGILLLTILCCFTLLQIPAFAEESNGEGDDCECNQEYTRYPLMELNEEYLHEMIIQNRSSNNDLIPPLLPNRSQNLLNRLDYDPNQRNQGSCGNCWAWASTGCLEIDYYNQFGSTMRFSIQYLNSLLHNGNLTGNGYACCGGNIDGFVNFYTTDTTFAIPWNNTNAEWRDGGTSCSTQTTVPVGNIATIPQNPINFIDAVHGWNDGGPGDGWFPYTGDKTVQINALKNVLDNNKSIYFSFHLPTQADWNVFFDFWDGTDGEDESTLFDFDYSDGHVQDAGAGGHAVLLVGYDDTDPNPDNHHWILLNSWGTAGGVRPNGLFRLRMSMDYNITFQASDGNLYYSLGYNFLETTFEPNNPPNADAGGPYLEDEGTSVTLNASNSIDPDGDPLQYRWDIDNDGVWDTAWSTNPTTTYTWHDDFNGIVKVQVTDGSLTDNDTATVTIRNVAPTITTTASDVEEHNQTLLNISITDPSNLDTFSVTIDWDDGTIQGPLSYPSGTTFISLSHQYLDDNPSGTEFDNYSVMVTVEDDDGGNDTENTSLTVFNVDPEVMVLSPNGGEAWSKTQYVIWTISDQGTEDTFLSNIYYSSDLGNHWELIEQNIPTNQGLNNYSWDTTLVNESNQSLIKIEVVDDDLGEDNDESNASFIVDNTPPVTMKHIFGSTFGPNHLYVNIPNTFQLTSFDNLSGVKTTYYRICYNGIWNPPRGTGVGINNDFMVYTSNFSLDQEGIYHVQFYSEDYADNIENKTHQIHIISDWWTQYRHDSANKGCSVSTIPNEPNVRWTTSLNSKILSSPSVLYQHHIYIGAMNGNVYCLHANNGSIQWTYETNGFIRSSPAVEDGRVYIGSSDNYLYCLDALTGNKIWSYETGHDIYSSPTVSDDYVFIGSNDGTLYCLDQVTGNLVWKASTGTFIYASPAVSEEYVYAASGNNYVYCFQKDSGDIVWKYLTEGVIFSSPTVTNHFVIVGSSDGHLYCLNASFGNLVWKYNTFGAMISSPAVCNNEVFIASAGGQLSCLDLHNGNVQWITFIGPVSYSSPAIANGKLVIGSENGVVYCVDTTDGDLIWSYVLHGSIQSSPAVYAENVFIGCNNGGLYCFGYDNGIFDDENEIPIAENDNYIVNKQSILEVNTKGILENDVDSDASPMPLCCELVSDVSCGMLSFHDDGSFTYHPEDGFVGNVTFSYHAFDGLDYSNVVEVSIMVSEHNDCPGDMNGDGILNAADIRYLALKICGNPSYCPLFDDGDVNLDGNVNTADIRYMAMNMCGNPSYCLLYPER